MRISHFFAVIICAVAFEASFSRIHGQAPSPAAAASVPTAASVAPLNLRSRTFHLYQRSLASGAVGYGLDGTYLVRPHEVVITTEGGPLVAHRAVVLHSLRVGICGSSEDGYADSVFSPEIMLNETRLAAGAGYRLPARVIRIPLSKAPPKQNWLCSVLSESGGNDVAEVPGRPVVISSGHSTSGLRMWRNRSPDNWSSEEIQAFLKDSPWAHTVLIQVPSDAIVNGHRSESVMRRVVRWESAPLLRHALLRIESKEYNDALANLSKDHYVIAVVSAGYHSGKASDLSSQWGSEQLEEQHQEIPSGLFSRTGLLKRADAIISPTRMVAGEISQGRVDLFLFPRALALETGNGDLDFTAAFPAGMGRASIAVKFSLKDMAVGLEGNL